MGLAPLAPTEPRPDQFQIDLITPPHKRAKSLGKSRGYEITQYHPDPTK
jgi:hypothetical protein